MSAGDPLPPYSYVPGGLWPHPISSPEGHSSGHRPPLPNGIAPGEGWRESRDYLRGHALFDAGYYWEAHEVWEGLWHAHGRKGPIADVLKALIKLAASGVKVREGNPRGVTTHARRAAGLFETVAILGEPRMLGLDLDRLAEQARTVADNPPSDPGPVGCAVATVFAFKLTPTDVP